jgi:hypothetical protein
MHIRMTGLGTSLGSLVAAGAVAAAGLLPAGSSEPLATPGTALVVDASVARDGRELVDPRLTALDAELRVPRTASEALTNVRYLAAKGYRVVVAGPLAAAAAADAGVPAQDAPGLAAALAAVGR